MYWKDGFMDISICPEKRANSRIVMNCQIVLYIAFFFVIIAFFDNDDLVHLSDDDKKQITYVSYGYLALTAILPTLQVQWFHRSWLFKCIPKCEVKIENDGNSEKLAVNSSYIQEEDAELKAQV